MSQKQQSEDPRKLFDEKPVDMADVEVGDWVRAKAHWSRPRQVVACERDSYVVLAEVDEDRQDQFRNRKVTADEWNKRGQWLSMPGLRALWEQSGRPIDRP
jgi:hypothetical protein